jgi:hypothetical protein
VLARVVVCVIASFSTPFVGHGVTVVTLFYGYTSRDGKRFVVRADEKLIAFLELE